METSRAGKQQASTAIQRADESVLANDVITAEMSADALREVCLHITENKGRESSQTLAALLRSLYLDGSMFNFGSLDTLGPVSRRHAEILIRTRIWDVIPIDVLEQAYEMVREYEFAAADAASNDAEQSFEPDAVVLEDVIDEPASEEENLPGPSASALPQRGQHLALVTPTEPESPAAEKGGKTSFGKTLLYAVVSLSAIAALVFILG